jgi:hypothetical protein
MLAHACPNRGGLAEGRYRSQRLAFLRSFSTQPMCRSFLSKINKKKAGEFSDPSFWRWRDALKTLKRQESGNLIDFENMTDQGNEDANVDFVHRDFDQDKGTERKSKKPI